MSLAALIEKMRKVADDFMDGELEELCKASEIVRQALINECYCTGETDYSNPPKLILCDACEALKKADSICADPGKNSAFNESEEKP